MISCSFWLPQKWIYRPHICSYLFDKRSDMDTYSVLSSSPITSALQFPPLQGVELFSETSPLNYGGQVWSTVVANCSLSYWMLASPPAQVRGGSAH